MGRTWRTWLSRSLKDSSPSSANISATVQPAIFSMSVSQSKYGYFNALATIFPTVLFPLQAGSCQKRDKTAFDAECPRSLTTPSIIIL